MHCVVEPAAITQAGVDRGAWSEDCNRESGPIVVKLCPANIFGSELFMETPPYIKNCCIVISKNDLTIDLNDEFEVSWDIRE